MSSLICVEGLLLLLGEASATPNDSDEIAAFHYHGLAWPSDKTNLKLEEPVTLLQLLQHSTGHTKHRPGAM
ncbi:hypothetical protein DFH05DRAFT_1126694 [Lentinula detonsa]|uniref:Uncharacterized protein n=1 Tax=Lentinula detonsa TaxID=2804962 RepID=A0A9W8P1M0_9AGAR|nr:hypothetical protein DFH05DRAFT_1126694 [Lentinula detonsa]